MRRAAFLKRMAFAWAATAFGELPRLHAEPALLFPDPAPAGRMAHIDMDLTRRLFDEMWGAWRELEVSMYET